MSVFTTDERAAWFPPQKLRPSEWTEQNRFLPPSVAAEAGRLSLSRTPYMYGILDAITEPGVQEVVALKSVQIGYSTALESFVGYFIDSDPGPILLVLDSQKTAQEVMDERIGPLVDNTPALQRRISPYSNDRTLQSMKFDSCPLFVGWAGSPGTLARRAIRYGLFDEVDKYPSNAGKEADPISLGVERTATYGHRRRILIGSTPTVRTGTIWRAWEACGDQRHFHVPCPHCGEYQVLVFTQVKWPELAIADRMVAADTIERQGLAHYECSHCKAPIQEPQRLRMISKGIWLSKGQTIARGGAISGNRPRVKRVGFKINSLYSPWRSFSAIAAEFLRSKNDPVRLQNFRNSWLAEVWEEIVKTTTVDDLKKLLDGAPEADKLGRVPVPSWAQYLVATADVQKDRFYYVVRAWGPEWKSQLISYGTAFSFDELRRHCLETEYILEGGGSSRPQLMFIDAGYRTDEVYRFAQSDERIKPVKGDNDTQLVPLRYSDAGRQSGVQLLMLNTQQLKDRLALFRSDPGRWMLNSLVDDEYLRHLASEHKTIIKGVEMWTTKTVGAANHLLDCEVYQLAAAQYLKVNLLTASEPPAAPQKPPETIARPAQQDPFTEMNSQQQPRPAGWLGKGKGWLDR